MRHGGVCCWLVLGAIAVTGAVHAAEAIEVPLQAEVQNFPGSGEQATLTGEFTLAEQSVFVKFGLAGDWSTGVKKAGAIYLTVDRDEGYEDRQPFPTVLGIGGALYAVDVRLDPPALVLCPYTGATAPVHVPIATERVSLQSPCRKVLLYRPGSEAMVPCGDYQLVEYQRMKQDAQGRAWYLCAEGTKDSPILKVRDGARAELDIGGPYYPKVDVDYEYTMFFRRWKKCVWLEISMPGRWMENVSDIRLAGETARSEHRFVARNDQGKTVAQGPFRYG